MGEDGEVCLCTANYFYTCMYIAPPLCAGTLLVVRRLACLKDSGSYTGEGLSPWQV